MSAILFWHQCVKLIKGVFHMYILWIYHIDGFVQDCSISIANALEILQSCTKPSICTLSISNVIHFTHQASGVCCENFEDVVTGPQCQTSNIRHTLVGNKLVDHSDVVGASPIGTAPTTSSFLTSHLTSMDWAKATARRDGNHLSLGIWCSLY